MNTKEETLLEYQKIESGKQKRLSAAFFYPSHRKEKVIILTRHLIDNILKISAQEALSVLSKDILKEYKLSILLAYVDKPAEYGPDDVRHLIYNAYPELEEDPKQLIIEVYKDVLSKKRARFPQDYFKMGDVSKFRAKILIEYLCLTILQIKNRQEFESVFFPPSKGIEVLRKYGLYPIYNAKVFPIYDQLFEDLFKKGELN